MNEKSSLHANSSEENAMETLKESATYRTRLAATERERMVALRRVVELEISLQDAHLEIDRLRNRLQSDHLQRGSQYTSYNYDHDRVELRPIPPTASTAFVDGGGNSPPLSPMTYEGRWVGENDMHDICDEPDCHRYVIDAKAGHSITNVTAESSYNGHYEAIFPQSKKMLLRENVNKSVIQSDGLLFMPHSDILKRKTKTNVSIKKKTNCATNDSLVGRMSKPRGNVVQSSLRKEENRSNRRPQLRVSTGSSDKSFNKLISRNSCGILTDRNSLHSRAPSSLGGRPCAIGSSKEDGKITLLYS